MKDSEPFTGKPGVFHVQSIRFQNFLRALKTCAVCRNIHPVYLLCC